MLIAGRRARSICAPAFRGIFGNPFQPRRSLGFALKAKKGGLIAARIRGLNVPLFPVPNRMWVENDFAIAKGYGHPGSMLWRPSGG
jgi:hypothetical protein